MRSTFHGWTPIECHSIFPSSGLSNWWGGPPGRGALWARTPSSRIFQGAGRPTGASAADQGVRPTISAAFTTLGRTSSIRPSARFGREFPVDQRGDQVHVVQRVRIHLARHKLHPEARLHEADQSEHADGVDEAAGNQRGRVFQPLPSRQEVLLDVAPYLLLVIHRLTP